MPAFTKWGLVYHAIDLCSAMYITYTCNFFLMLGWSQHCIKKVSQLLKFVLSSSYHLNMVTLTPHWHTLSGIICNPMSCHLECTKLPAHSEINPDTHPSYLWTKSFKAATSSLNLAPKLGRHGRLRMCWTPLMHFTWIPTLDYMILSYLDNCVVNNMMVILKLFVNDILESCFTGWTVEACYLWRFIALICSI